MMAFKQFHDPLRMSLVVTLFDYDPFQRSARGIGSVELRLTPEAAGEVPGETQIRALLRQVR